MARYDYPTSYEEESFLSRDGRCIPIEGVSTAVAGFIGFTEDIRNGAELSKPMLVKSWVQYLKYFAEPGCDGFTDFNAYLPFAVYGYFLNGGTRCWVTSIGTRLPEQLPDRSQLVHKDLSGALVIPDDRQHDHRPCFNLLLRPEKVADSPIQIVVSDGAPRLLPPANDRDGKEETPESAPCDRRKFFTLQIKQQNEVLEQYEHLTIDSEVETQTATYVIEALESSKYVTIQDTAQFDDKSTNCVSRPLNGEYELYPFLPTTSYDRFAQEVEGDYYQGTGVRGIFKIDEISTVAFPDLMRAYEAAILNLDQVHGIMELMVSICEGSISSNILNLPKRMVVFAPPPECVEPSKVAQWLEEFGRRSMFAALYYPWIQVRNPRDKGQLISVPPCGHMMGVWARIDRRFGVHKAPTNVVTEGVLNLAYDVNYQEQERLNSLGINCICEVPDLSIRILGARTLAKHNTDWRYISVRRLANYIETSIERGIQQAVFELKDRELLARVRRLTRNFLHRIWLTEALLGNESRQEEAFFVKCDEENNPRETMELGLHVDVGIAPARPNEFVTFRISCIN